MNIYVKGEVSGKYISPSGHLYFDLKDKHSKVPCIVYHDNRKSIGFEIENGMKLLVMADVNVYYPHGKYQLSIRSATDEGIGRLTLAYQQLKKKLKNEGLFDDAHKKPLPEFPKSIGVVTSKGGSVIHDIVKTVRRDWPYCNVLLFPSSVQGVASKSQLVSQIRNADDYGVDVLIVARGGGSLEDLWSFNEEAVVRTVFECQTPVISAIGHEDNVTLCDLVADRCASTPTMAAGLAIKNKGDVLSNISHLNSRLLTFMSTEYAQNKKDFDNILSKAIFTDSSNVYKSKKADFEMLQNRFDAASNEIVVSNTHELEKIKTSYLIRHPCKLQLDSSKSSLNELEIRLIEAMNSIINNNKVNLDRLSNNFDVLSKEMITSHSHELNKIRTSFFIRNPCRMQLDSSKSTLNDFSLCLRNSVDDIVNKKKTDLDRLSDEFDVLSKEMITSHSHELNKIRTSFFIRNPCRMQLESSKAKLNEVSNSLMSSLNDVIGEKQANLDKMSNEFRVISNEVILNERHRLDNFKKSYFIENPCRIQLEQSNVRLKSSQEKLAVEMKTIIEASQKELEYITKKSVLRNPNKIYESRIQEFEKAKDSKIIKNPFSLLDSHKRELSLYEEKLDKINQVLMLKKAQQEQKSKYMKIIAVTVALVVILLIIMFGGIL